MGPSGAALMGNYWNDGGGSGGELRCAINSFCNTDTAALAAGIRIEEEVFGDVSVFEQSTSRKRSRDDQSSTGAKSKSCCEKLRRDRLNIRFAELGSILDSSRPPKLDRQSILSDACRLLLQLKAQVRELEESNEKLKETVKDLKVEKNELRDEKMKLKAVKERLQRQVEYLPSSAVPPAHFMPHPNAFPPFAPAAFQTCIPAPSNKAAFYSNPFAGMPMWQFLPPGVVDTSQDTKLCSPNA